MSCALLTRSELLIRRELIRREVLIRRELLILREVMMCKKDHVWDWSKPSSGEARWKLDSKICSSSG